VQEFQGSAAAYRIHEKNPGLSYTVLERVSGSAATWDLFAIRGSLRQLTFHVELPLRAVDQAGNVADVPTIGRYSDRDGPARTRHRRGTSGSTRSVVSAEWEFDHRHVDGARPKQDGAEKV
jgi:hypothetical protein